MTVPRNPTQDNISEEMQVAAASVITDGSGDIEVTFANLRRIIENSVRVTLEGGFIGNVQSVSGSVATVRIYQGAATADSAFAAVTSSSLSTILHAKAVGY